MVRRLPPEASAVKAVGQALYYFDSGALAALLKELNKSGHVRRAQEVRERGAWHRWRLGAPVLACSAAGLLDFAHAGLLYFDCVGNPCTSMHKAHPKRSQRSPAPPRGHRARAWGARVLTHPYSSSLLTKT